MEDRICTKRETISTSLFRNAPKRQKELLAGGSGFSILAGYGGVSDCNILMVPLSKLEMHDHFVTRMSCEAPDHHAPLVPCSGDSIIYFISPFSISHDSALLD